MKLHRSQQGFTLLEMLVAVMVISVILGVIYGSFFGTSRTYALLESNEDVYRTAQTLTSMLSRELRAASFDPKLSAGLLGTGGESGEEGTDEIFFVTRAHRRSRENAKEGYMAEIGYFFDVDELNGEKRLFKSVDLTVDDDIREGGKFYPLTDRLESLNFSYYNKKDDAWVEEWDAKNQGKLPDYVLAEFSILDDNDKATLFRTVIKPMMEK
jgi:general secretion pathway protein J